MPRTERAPSRRERIAALAATAAYNPEEAAVAQAMLDNLPRDLDAIAEDIKAEYGKSIESQFAIGRLLIEARATFGENDKQFGHWMAAQQFPFVRATALRLRIGAEREAEVRELIAESRMTQNVDLGVVTAVMRLNSWSNKPKAEPTIPLSDTTPVDPGVVALLNAYNALLGVVEGEPTVNTFLSMHMDDLAKCAGYIRALVTAYQEARNARS